MSEEGKGATVIKAGASGVTSAAMPYVAGAAVIGIGYYLLKDKLDLSNPLTNAAGSIASVVKTTTENVIDTISTTTNTINEVVDDNTLNVKERKDISDKSLSISRGTAPNVVLPNLSAEQQNVFSKYNYDEKKIDTTRSTPFLDITGFGNIPEINLSGDTIRSQMTGANTSRTNMYSTPTLAKAAGYGDAPLSVNHNKYVSGLNPNQPLNLKSISGSGSSTSSGSGSSTSSGSGSSRSSGSGTKYSTKIKRAFS